MPIASTTFSFPWEVSLIEWLQMHLSPAVISVMSFFSYLGEDKVLFVMIGLIYWGFDKKLARSVTFCVLTASMWGSMIKNVVIRRRPYFDHKGIKIYQPVDRTADIYDITAQGYSFPSGHSVNAVTLWGSLGVQTRKKWLMVIGVLAPLLAGCSRVVVGAHYPTDVLAGWIIGLVVIFLFPVIENRISNPFIFYGLLVATGIPGLFFCKSNDFFTAYGMLAGFALASLFEERYVQFEYTKKPFRIFLRVLCGILLYVVLNQLLKMPFSKSFLESGSQASLLVRFGRNMVISFVLFGIYPMVFKKQEKTADKPSES